MSDSKKGKKHQTARLSSKDDITAASHPDVNDSSSISKVDEQDGPDTAFPSSSGSGRALLGLNPVGEHGHLRRGLSARQVQMIAIAGK